ncbi:hypothetical protein [Aurantimonas marina]|uniref:hypothetical protein n=1 Tax=Aurantimonas marina TaxID=2780508 RepID=UPI0019D229B9|nr:hypothetical protein [Aurantimonas marina]
MLQVLASGAPRFRSERVARDDPAICHAIGSATRPIAEAYARATGRAFHPLSSPAPHRLGGGDVVVTLADDLTDDLVDAATAPGAGSVAGFLIGRSLEELGAKAAASAAALWKPLADVPFRLDLSPQLPIGVTETRDFALCGRASDTAHLRRLLGRGDSLISVTGHGDGIDGDLGPLVLCPVDAAFDAEDRPRKPSCRVSGHCHRFHIGHEMAAFAGASLHPAAIKARAMIWNTCVGWPSQDNFIDRSYGAGVRLAASPALGALVTTARIVIASPVSVDLLAGALSRGMPIGDAVAAHNRAPQALASGHRFVLFGDPLLRVAPQPASINGAGADTPRLPTSARLAASPPRPSRPPLAPVAADDPDQLALAALATLSAIPGVADLRPRAFACLTDALAKGGLEGVWVRASQASMRGAVPCPHCGNHASRLMLDGSPAVGQRLLTICRRCEVAADTPPEPSFSAHLDTGGVWRLRGERPRTGNWLGSLVVRRCEPFTTVIEPWPTDADGRPRTTLDCGRFRGPAPMTLAAMFYARRQLSIFSRPLPARPEEVSP